MHPVIAALPWAAPLCTLPWLARRTPQLSWASPRAGHLLSVIVPARNESETIDTVVRSILATRYEPFELLVVDDRSTDDTAEQVERLAAEDSRVRLVRGEELPAGWYGKPWACHQGARAARGDLIVFVDADTRHEPALFEHAVGALLAERASMVSLLPFQQCVTFWERAVMPQVWYLLGMRYRPSRVNRATRARDVIANGQFILVTRDAYGRVGAHAAVRGEVVEDLALAQRFFQMGEKLHIAHAEDLMETRMYRSLTHLIEGWSKNVYLGGLRSFPDEPLLRALVPLLLMAAPLFWLAPFVGLVVALASGNSVLGRVAVMAIASSAVFWAALCATMRIPPRYGLAYPFGTAVLLHIFLRSLWRGGRRVEWRGRTYGTSNVAEST